jgi:hypothetical protein
MNEKEEDFAKPIDEVNELFFGPDDRQDLDLSAGRPNKEVTEGNDEPKAKRKKPKKTKAQEEADALVKKANFLLKFEEKLKKRNEAEEKQRIEREAKKEQKRQVKAKQEARKQQPSLGQYRYASIGADYCEHEDKVRHMNGGRITTCCRKCSRVRDWTMSEWSAYVTKSKSPPPNNPDRGVFPM